MTPHEQKKAKILIVDDLPSEQKMIAMALEREPYEVITASNGKEAVEMTKKEKPNLIILDIMMPEKDGLEVCKELKTDAKLSAIPIIILTAIGDSPLLLPEFQRATGSPYAEDYIDKPVDPNFLLAKVKKLLNSH